MDTSNNITTFEDFIKIKFHVDWEMRRDKHDREMLQELTTGLENLEAAMEKIREHRWRHPTIFVEALFRSLKAKYNLGKVADLRYPAFKSVHADELEKMKEEAVWQESYQRYLTFIQSENEGSPG